MENQCKTTARMQRFGLVVGTISLIAAIANLAFFYRISVFTYISLFLGPMAFCGALVAFSHGSWRIASAAGFLSICGSVLDGTRMQTLQSWQLVVFWAAIAAGIPLACWLWANYRKEKSLERRPRMAAGIAEMQCRLGILMGGSSLAIGLIVWLQFDLASCSLYSGHLAERYSSPPYAASFLAPIAFLLGVSTIGCGFWRLGTVTIHVSLGVLVALTHALGDPISGELVLLTAPLSLFFWPLLSAPLHSLYGPWISVILAAILFASWRAGKTKQSD